MYVRTDVGRWLAWAASCCADKGAEGALVVLATPLPPSLMTCCKPMPALASGGCNPTIAPLLMPSPQAGGTAARKPPARLEKITSVPPPAEKLAPKVRGAGKRTESETREDAATAAAASAAVAGRAGAEGKSGGG
jgi:hypothetical protein